MADERVVTELVIDASGAVRGAAQYSAAMDSAEAATAGLVQKQDAVGASIEKTSVTLNRQSASASAAERDWNRLRAAVDPVTAAQLRMEAAQNRAERAVMRGLTTNEAAARVVDLYRDRYDAAVAATSRFGAAQAVANDNLARASVAGRGFGSVMQQAGFQIGDFAVQVASGQGVLRPLIQQGSQLAGAFGPWGAVLGAVGAIVGAVATAFIGMIDAEKGAADAAKALDTSLKSANDTLKQHQDLGAALKTQQADEIGRVADLARYYRSLTGELRDFERVRLEIRKNDLNEQAANIRAQTDAGLGSVASITRVAQNALDMAEQSNRRRAALGATPLAGPPEQILQAKAALDAFNASSEKSPEAIRLLYTELYRTSQLGGPFSKSLLEAAKAIEKPAMQAGDLKTRLDEVNKSIKLLGQSNEQLDAAAGAPDAIKKATEQQKALQKAIADAAAQQDQDRLAAIKRGQQIIEQDNKRYAGLEQYIVGLENAATIDATTVEAKKTQQALIEAQNKLIDDQGHKLRDLTDAEKQRITQAVHISQAYEEQQRFWKDVTKTAQGYADDVKGYLLDGLTGVTNQGKSMWQSMWDAAEAGLKRFLINAALEVAETPMVLPAKDIPAASPFGTQRAAA